MNFLLETYALSDTGKVRQHNEDSYGSFSGSYGNLFVVCDGLGGTSGGEIASQLAVESIKNYFCSLDGKFNPEKELENSVIAANDNILRNAKSNPELIEMGSTVTMLLIKDNNAYISNLGDSRIYLIRDGGITQLTRDHSFVQQLIDQKIITPEEAKYHPKRNIITRSLGISTDAVPDVVGPLNLQIDDCFILCSDGLTSYVEDAEINKIALNFIAREACDKLVELANERGGGDNITVQVVKITGQN